MDKPRVSELFRRLVDLTPEAREQFFAAQAVDPGVRREVEDLLKYDSTGNDRFSELVDYASMAMLGGDAVGTRCGPFRLLSILGRGGMGIVYLAERVDGEVTQRAAIKLLQPGWSPIQRERFMKEREILAGLSHPNIAHLLDAGHLRDGQPYLAMEYVDGKPIHEYSERFTVRQKIELFLKVCRTVAYLHANSVVHRDLKPNNILVPALGEPKLLDFGIAKLLDLQGDATVTHLRMLTPDYASPEQLSGADVGTASDIYSLGAVLHRLLTGKSRGEDQGSEILPELKGDLGRVLETAMRKEPEERYATVEELVDDLQACLDSRPIRSRHGELIYRARKFVRRHSLSVMLTSALTIAMSVGVFSWYQFRNASTVTDRNPKRLTANTLELPIQSAAISADGKSVAYSDPLGIHLYDIAGGDTRLLANTIGHQSVQWMPDGATLQTQVLDEAGRVTAMLVSTTGGDPTPSPTPAFVKLSPDQAYRALPAGDGNGLVVQDADGNNSREIWRSAKNPLEDFTWSPNSKRIAVLNSSGANSSLETIDITSGHKITLVPEEKKLAIGAIVWPTQNRLIIANYERAFGVNSQGGSNLWEVRLNASGTLAANGLRKLTNWTDYPIRSGSLTTDGKKIVFIRSFRQRDVYVAGISPGRLSMETPRRLTMYLGDDYPTAWTRDSKAVVFTSDRNGPSAVFLQQLGKQSALQLAVGPTSQIVPRVSPDGKSILFFGRDQGRRGLLRVPVTGGTAQMWFETSNVADFRCARAGRCVLVERHNGARVIFELDLVHGKGREIYRDDSPGFGTPDISPDGKWLATASGPKVIVRSFATGAIVKEVVVRGLSSPPNLVTMDYAPDGKGFFAGDSSPAETRQLYIDLSGKASVLWRQAGKSTVWGIPSPDGKYLAMMLYADESNVYLVDEL